MVALDVEVSERSGSRVGLFKDGNGIVVHRPHPQPAMGRMAVRAIIRFLVSIGVTP